MSRSHHPLLNSRQKRRGDAWLSNVLPVTATTNEFVGRNDVRSGIVHKARAVNERMIAWPEFAGGVMILTGNDATNADNYDVRGSVRGVSRQRIG